MAPLSKHYGGKGAKVAKTMKKEYGSDWKKYFYGHENNLKKKSIKRNNIARMG